MARGLRVLSALAAALFSVEAARIKRAGRGGGSVGAEFIGGVPVLNYHLAYGGRTSLVERKGVQKWVVVVKDGVTDEQVDALCQLSKCVREGHPSKQGVPYFEIEATEADLQKVVAAGSSMMKFIEPDVEMSMIPDILVDTVQSDSWGLGRVGVPDAAGKGKGVNVYILDTGIRVTHTDYGGRASAYLDLSSGKLQECGGSRNCAGDKQGHGSHCAGTAAGGNYGVAPEASIFAIKVLSDSGSGEFSWSYDALDYLASSGDRPAVASMSLGGRGVLDAMEAAVDSAVSAGVVVVVAAGNSNADACGFSPAFVPSAITVGSTDSRDVRSSFSCYGSCVDIWAPGSDITSCGIKSDTSAQTYSGTSMACPHVSGGAALILEKNTGFSSADVVSAMDAEGQKGAIADLKTGDTNLFLWVSAKPAPVPAPTPAPPPCPWKCNNWFDCRFDSACEGCC